MNDEIRKNLIDILQAAEEIQAFTDGMDLRAYRGSPVTQRAVERDFEIIGEALSRIKKIDERVLRNISQHHRIISFRNILIHGYDMVDELIVWNAVENHLPVLIKEIQDLLHAKPGRI
jgi:uncharacterized protein with HEPN domain